MANLPQWLVGAFSWLWAAVKNHAKSIGIIAAIGAAGGVVSWLSNLRKTWREGTLAKEQLEKFRQERYDEENFHLIVKQMEDSLNAWRREKKIHGDVILNEDFFVERLPSLTRIQIRKGLAVIEEKQKKWRERFGR
jgi:hypothetical protein